MTDRNKVITIINQGKALAERVLNDSTRHDWDGIVRDAQCLRTLMLDMPIHILMSVFKEEDT